MTGGVGALNYGTTTGEVFIEDDSATEHTLHGPAWCCLNAEVLWLPNAVRQGNPVIPRVGSYPVEYFPGEGHYTLEMAFTGWYLPNGTRTTGMTPLGGLVKNLRDFRALVVDPPAVGATRAARLALPDGSNLTAAIQVLLLRRGKIVEGKCRAMLDIVIPGDGVFA